MSRMTDKRAFFGNLEQLDCLSDGSENEFERVISSSLRKDEKVSSPSSCQHENLSHPPRPSVTLPSSKDEIIAHGLSSAPSIASVVEVRNHEPSSKDMGTSGKHAAVDLKAKRKRGSSEKVIPEQRQIFRGLVFFFFPNSDVSPLRRLRIQRAQEYGAQCAKTWGNNITHVIVDRGLKFEEVLKHLQLEAVPVAVVDEGYPAACIDFRSILSVTQVRFQVNGAPCSEAQRPSEKSPEDPSAADPGSLPLKPYHKEQVQTQRSSLLPPNKEQSGAGQTAELVGQEELTEEIIRDSFADRQPDALDEMIEEAKAWKDLPLDPLDVADAPGDDASIEGSDDETSDDPQATQSRRKKRKPSRDEQTATGSWQRKFACMQKHDSTSNSQNPNTRTIDVLRQMLEYYTRTADHWRILAYRKAISALSKQSKKVVTRAEALKIPGVGTRLADKIEEIVVTDRLRRLDNISKTAEDRLLHLFLGVYGAGLAVASRWIAQGYKSLDDLRAKASLTQSQRVGLDHYYDFSQRIPRCEVQAHGDIVQRMVQKESPRMQVIIGGSYRRGAANSADIDIIITRHDATIEEIRKLMLDTVIPKLFQQGFLQVGLATTSRDDGSKWHGASKLPNGQLWRRMDLLFVPGAELGAAMIYFTGNDIFNRSMRLLASKKSMRLNQRGLYADVLRGPQRTKINTGRLLEGRDERRIFEILGVPWRPPEHRIC
ncbi:DNA-directed DNA polymerase IV [Aspergillus undulatus]|uniref:DNA-directed DNA polymerase IV n=1 Tax=Aspergillus undulatus TaxID=1810928 RepID=UPI003CCCEEDA